MRPDNPTHVTDVNERSIAVSFTQAGHGELKITLPSNPNLVPPSYYMLFAINSKGIPSGRLLGPGPVRCVRLRPAPGELARGWPWPRRQRRSLLCRGGLRLAARATSTATVSAPGCTPIRPTRSSPPPRRAEVQWPSGARRPS